MEAMKKKVVAIVQARMSSTRLPGKVMMKIGEKPMIEVLLLRLSKSRLIDEVILATGENPSNKSLIHHVNKLGIKCVIGSDSDVLNRYVKATKESAAETVVRITGDCPLIDPELVDSVIKRYMDSNFDYLSNSNPPTFPDGLDVEVFSSSALFLADDLATESYDREHVTPFIRNSDLFSKGIFANEKDLSSLRWTVDEHADFEVISSIFSAFNNEIFFSWQEVLKLEQSNPQIFTINKDILRNEGSKMSTGQKLWRRAKRVVPGGNMLLSKRPEMFLPDHWPVYFSKAKGCKVWDLDGVEYVDMSIMGIGTNTLGYGHPEIDAAVSKAVAHGNMSTLNCPEEVYLAERLVEIHPWAEMVRFARSGGEANAIAIRIARAASGRDGVAVCGYHGWHDWYLAANLADQEGLSGHLLPGLTPHGVPKGLHRTIFPFEYNDLSALEEIVSQNNIGVIMMEVVRNFEPQNNFLQKVRELATKLKIVLVFDECTSGFRETFGGIHKKYKVEPDMAMFGKALGNGYAITAVIGRRNVMESAQSSFISSTFWTERIGPVAALKTLDVMEQLNSWELITVTGASIRDRWQKLANQYSLKISHWGLPALAGFSFEGKHALAYKTLITQEMLKKGFLASNSVYVCTEHTQQIIDFYFNALEPVFFLIAECESGRNIYDLLKGPVCHNGFKRLN